MQDVWAGKWCILKSGMIFAGEFPYNEMAPDLLENLCYLIGFDKVEWTEHTEIYQGGNVLNSFQKRFDALLKEIVIESLRAGFSEMAMDVRNKAA